MSKMAEKGKNACDGSESEEFAIKFALGFIGLLSVGEYWLDKIQASAEVLREGFLSKKTMNKISLEMILLSSLDSTNEQENNAKLALFSSTKSMDLGKGKIESVFENLFKSIHVYHVSAAVPLRGLVSTIRQALTAYRTRDYFLG